MFHAKVFLMFAGFLFIFSVTPSVQAQEKPVKNDWKMTVDTNYFAMSDIDDDKGRFEVHSGDVSLKYSHLRIGYQFSNYTWENKNDLTMGNKQDDPFDKLHSMYVGFDYDNMLSRQWGYFVLGALRSSFEEEMSNSFSGILSGGAIYVWSRQLQARAGIGIVASKPDTKVIPAVGVTWNMAAAKGFKCAVGFPRTELRYVFNPMWAVHSNFSWDTNTYKLAHDSTLMEKGWIDVRTMIVGAYVSITPFEDFVVTFGPEYLFNRKITVYKENARKDDDYRVDNSWGLRLKLSYSF
jgi:hypothetical protein